MVASRWGQKNFQLFARWLHILTVEETDVGIEGHQQNKQRPEKYMTTKSGLHPSLQYTDWSLSF